MASYKVTDQWSIAASADNDYSKADESYEFHQLYSISVSDGSAELKAVMMLGGIV